MLISEEKIAEPASVPISVLVEELFDQRFGGHDDEDHRIDFANDEQPPVTPALDPATSAKNDAGPFSK